MYIAEEGSGNIGKSIWITIKNIFRKIVTWFKNLLLNINYFKNAQLDEQLNKDLISVLQVSQPRTELNFNVLQKFYTNYSRFKPLNTQIDGKYTGIMYQNPRNPFDNSGRITDLQTEIEKSINDIDDATDAAKKSSEYERI
jgi:hypothetical protein